MYSTVCVGDRSICLHVYMLNQLEIYLTKPKKSMLCKQRIYKSSNKYLRKASQVYKTVIITQILCMWILLKMYSTCTCTPCIGGNSNFITMWFNLCMTIGLNVHVHVQSTTKNCHIKANVKRTSQRIWKD